MIARNSFLIVLPVMFGWSTGDSRPPVLVKNIATGIDDATGQKLAYRGQEVQRPITHPPSPGMAELTSVRLGSDSPENE